MESIITENGAPSNDNSKAWAPEYHASLLHSGGRGRVAVAQRIDGKWRETTVPVSDLADFVRDIPRDCDSYLSQNRFWGRRAIARLAQLDALFADLDYYRTGYADRSPGSVVVLALQILEDNNMPLPTFATVTGRGVALVWLHSPVPFKALSRWRACQKEIHRVLKPLGADPMAMDAARVLRLVGTRNSRSGTVVEAIDVAGEQWDFEDLAAEILPLDRGKVKSLREARERRARRRQARTGAARFFNAETLWAARYEELQRLRLYRYGGPLPQGERDHWLFIASIALSWLAPVERMQREMLQLCQDAAGWSESEARARMSAVVKRAQAAAQGQRLAYGGTEVDPRYRLTSRTIVEWLNISPAEIRDCGFRALVDEDTRREHRTENERQRRRRSGAISRQDFEARAAKRAQEAARLKASGLTWSEVAEKMQLSSPEAARKLARRAPAGQPDRSVALYGGVAEAVASRRGRNSLQQPAAMQHAGLPSRRLRARQLDLFGGPQVEGLELAAWQGGKAPAELRAAVRWKLRELDWRQEDLARFIGRSRPHLTNALRGRFGLDGEAAARLKQFLTRAA